MSALGLNQKVDSATHTSGNTLDLVFVEAESDFEKRLVCHVHDFLSDHRWVICDTMIDHGKPKVLRVQKRVMKDQAENILKQNFSDLDVLSCDDHEHASHLLEKELGRIYDLAAPLKTIKIAERLRVPWFTKDIAVQKRIVRNRQKIWLKYREDHQWEAYKRERKRYRNMLNYSKKCCFTRTIKNVHGDAKKLYSFIAHITSSKPLNPMPPAESDAILADQFADFFLDKIAKIRQRFTEDSGKYKLKDSGCPVFRKFSTISESEVLRLIREMKVKSCELDAIPTKHLMSLIPEVIPAITRVVNLSLSQAVFNTNWKCAIVRPLIKKQDGGREFKNYRPVSNLSFLSKLLEKAALDQFINHCDEYDLMPDHQSAYRRGYSCETCVLYLVNNILWAMENGEILVCCMLDLSAAFDTIDHDKILQVLKVRFGIVDDALAWYDSYLRPRRFKVCVNNHYSEDKHLVSSVPQGSASGANLFTAFCSPYEDIIPDSLTLYGFADDHFTTGTYPAGDLQKEKELMTQLHELMVNTEDWMNDMKLKLNSDKTELIHFGSRAQLKKVTINNLDVGKGTLIKGTNVVRSLGSYLDSNLNLKVHVTKKCQAALINFRKIRSIRKYLDKSTTITLILTLVMSHIDYCNSILLGIPQVTLRKFERVQSMCAKLVLGRVKSDSTRECLRELNWLPIKARIEYKVLTLLHKCIYGDGPKYLKNLLTILPEPPRRLRSSSSNTKCKLLVPYVKKKTFAERSISIGGPRLWNTLPENVRTNDNLLSFSKEIKTFLYTKYLY